jgi:hypothetical protein
MVEHVSWCAGECRERFTDVTSLNTLITTIDLGPCFLEQLDPDFFFIKVLAGATERPLLFVRVVWKQVVDDYFARNAIEVELQSVKAAFLHLLLEEDLLNTLRKLCNRAEARQKVAVSAMALLDVIRFNVVEQEIIRFKFLNLRHRHNARFRGIQFYFPRGGHRADL